MPKKRTVPEFVPVIEALCTRADKLICLHEFADAALADAMLCAEQPDDRAAVRALRKAAHFCNQIAKVADAIGDKAIDLSNEVQKAAAPASGTKTTTRAPKAKSAKKAS